MIFKICLLSNCHLLMSKAKQKLFIYLKKVFISHFVERFFYVRLEVIISHCDSAQPLAKRQAQFDHRV